MMQKKELKCKKYCLYRYTSKNCKKRLWINEKLQIIKKARVKETKPIVLIFGGSQGAQKINEAILTILKNKLNKDYQIMWATGPKQYDIIRKNCQMKILI